MTKTAIWFLVSLLMLFLPPAVWSDQAQYVYDELGRVIGVVDGQGNVAVYQYDPVGNLLSIQRYTPGTSGVGLFLLAPTSVAIGATVQLQGFGFSPTPSANQVAVNGIATTVVSATPTTLVVTVPSGATSGPVTVTTASGTAISPQPLTVLVPPIIAGVVPNRVAQGVTTQVVITGFNLDTVTAVTFAQSGLTATILAGATGPSLPIALSVSASVPLGAYPFAVSGPAGTAQSGSVLVTVSPATTEFSTTGVSVFLPFPPAAGPTGAGFSPADVSVFLPFPSPGGGRRARAWASRPRSVSVHRNDNRS